MFRNQPEVLVIPQDAFDTKFNVLGGVGLVLRMLIICE